MRNSKTNSEARKSSAASKPSPNPKGDTSLPYHLTRSEIESLRRDKKRIAEYAKGKFRHLQDQA